MHVRGPVHRDRRCNVIFIMIPADDNINFFLDLAFTYKSLQWRDSGN
jgi:hypothetical protein